MLSYQLLVFKFCCQVYTDGITNKLVGVYHKNGSKSEQLLVRVYGNKTDLFIDRSKEKRNIQVSKSGLHSLNAR